jgi:molecular chaperone IbpA
MNKPLRLTSEVFNPLWRSSIGFERFVDDFFSDPLVSGTQTGYPPYNIAKKSNGVYEILLAAAGFQKDEINISLEKGTLTIKGEVTNADDTVEYLYKGIAERSFVRSFKLAEFVEVQNAEFKDGILRVSLIRNVPDEMMPQQIQIA